MFTREQSPTIRTIGRDQITEQIMRRIFTIEQDMWSRSIGEYLQCTDCHSMISKSQAYQGYDIPDSILHLPVGEIENIYGTIPPCPCCGGKAVHIYDVGEYLPKIEERYMNKRASFLTVAENQQGEIIGFIDGYISDLQDIYLSEFRDHFHEGIMKTISERYDIHDSQNLFTVSSIGTLERYRSLITTLNLLKVFFRDIPEKYDYTPGIVETIVGTSTFCIFLIMGAERMGKILGIESTKQISKNPDISTDIIYQAHPIAKYKKTFNVGIRDVVLFSREFNNPHSQVTMI